ncbi:MAG: transposase [Vicinamibacterales bacterium]
MPRRLRLLPAASVAHVVNRGNDRRRLFDRAQEFDDFLRLVSWAKAQCPVRIVAYCIMSNHWHFVFWPELDGDVSAFLHRLTTTHAISWRKRTGTLGHGHVYQDRFKASTIFTEHYYFNAVRYVEQNPFRAGIVNASSEWRWSSLAERLGTRHGILDDGPTSLPIDWPALVDETISEEVLEEIRKSLRRH